MVKYVPPPANLEDYNPIQRYMNKGSLDRQDYLRLIALVLVYWFARPYIQKFFRYFSGHEIKEGEEEQEAYKQRRAQAAIQPNAIRGAKSKGQTQTLADVLDETSGAVATTSGSKVEESNGGADVINRKKGTAVATQSGKSGQETLLEWDDQPARKPVDGDKADVMKWLDKWDKDVEQEE